MGFRLITTGHSVKAPTGRRGLLRQLDRAGLSVSLPTGRSGIFRRLSAADRSALLLQEADLVEVPLAAREALSAAARLAAGLLLAEAEASDGNHRVKGKRWPKMKSILTIMTVLMAALLLMTSVAAQSEQAVPPLSQPLVREGALAIKLADAFKLGASANEVEAESALSAKGIAPRNGWIADYPLTPDIAGELQIAITDSAEAGDISQDRDTALKSFQDVMADFNLPLVAESPVEGESSAVPDYPDADAQVNYYDNEGPPEVTYYAPPPDYAYMYDWVSSPFWWSGVWFPGFFVLLDLDRDHRHGRKRGNGHYGVVGNRSHDTKTGSTVRVDPSGRTNGSVPKASGGQTSPVTIMDTRAGSASGSTCSSCHYSAPSGGNRSTGFFGSNTRSHFRGHVGGSFGGGWRR